MESNEGKINQPKQDKKLRYEKLNHVQFNEGKKMCRSCRDFWVDNKWPVLVRRELRTWSGEYGRRTRRNRSTGKGEMPPPCFIFHPYIVFVADLTLSFIPGVSSARSNPTQVLRVFNLIMPAAGSLRVLVIKACTTPARPVLPVKKCTATAGSVLCSWEAFYVVRYRSVS